MPKKTVSGWWSAAQAAVGAFKKEKAVQDAATQHERDLADAHEEFMAWWDCLPSILPKLNETELLTLIEVTRKHEEHLAADNLEGLREDVQNLETLVVINTPEPDEPVPSSTVLPTSNGGGTG